MVQANRHTTHKNAVSKDEQGVSAVIGVILMVAVTVILAAVIGAFVFNMYPNLLPNQGAQPFAYDVHSDGKVVITNNGGIQATGIEVNCNDFDNYVTSGTPAVTTLDISAISKDTDFAKLQEIGRPMVFGDGDEKFYAGMTITITGEINGNRVVLSKYVLPDTYKEYTTAPAG